jgi:DNA replication licensing factor MCM3
VFLLVYHTLRLIIDLSWQVSKSDVDAALKVLNFAIYHKELTEMEEREHEREKELERKRRADHPGGNDGDHRPGKKDRRDSGTSDVEG